MKRFTDRIFENENKVENALNNFKNKMNSIKDLEVEVSLSESGGNVNIDVNFTMEKNLTKITPKVLITILNICEEHFSPYIDQISYKERENRMNLKLKTFKHKI